MRFVQMHTNGPEANASAEANKLIKDDKQVARNGVANGGERGLLEENRPVKDVQKTDFNVLDPQALYPQPPYQVIHWERFLHVRTLKVLLVENDDSTRHIVSALLRNCSYQVIAVSNGLQAWKILENISIHIDIVLSEVVMPGLSGIALLSKIMNHKTRKTTPVIMTSSHDSMGIVYKCLSKGAIDFLAKPIRKNELKNLWQHVWRKCHSSSGSGSESGVQNQKSLRSRSSGEDSENESRSREEYDNRSIDLLRHDGSDNGSGTQSSWTKKAVDVESPKSMSPWEQRSDTPDSTCAQVIHSRSEGFASSWVPTSSKENKGLNGQCENVAKEKNLERGTTAGSQNSLEEESEKCLVEVTGNVKNHAAPVELKNEGNTQVGSDNRVTAELIGEIDSNRDKTSASKQLFCVSQNCKSKDEGGEKAKERPSLELTLKRVGDLDVRAVAADQNSLRHSELSAFTRYPNGKQTPTGNVGSCSPEGNSSEAAKTDTPANGVSNDSSNNDDMGSTTYRSFTKPTEVIDKPSAVECGANPSAEQQASEGGGGGGGQEVQVQHHYHHYHHHHHHVHCLPQLKQQLQKRDEPKIVECGSGSNHGSNQNTGGCITAVDVEGTNMESDDWTAAVAVTPEGDVAAGSGSGTGLDQELSAQKEASMNKICQKRKERCFDKRVRYQSRKKPAEDRPHMHSPIMHQDSENNCKDADT